MLHAHPFDRNQAKINVAWMDDWVPRVIYVFAIFGLKYLIDIFSFGMITDGLAWSIVHTIHAMTSFYILHWAKGSAFYSDSREVLKLTLWEQINGERVFTPARKFLIIVVILLYAFFLFRPGPFEALTGLRFIKTWHMNDYKMDLVNTVNWILFLLLFIAKLPSVHRVRFFGINNA